MGSITEKIRILCADRKMSKEELAKEAGLTNEQINRICSTDQIPSLASLIKIARALGVRLGTFLDDSEEMGPVVHRHSFAKEATTFTSHQTSPNAHMDFVTLAGKKAGRNMEPFLVNIHSGTGKECFSSHEGEEFLFVLSGSIIVHYGKEKHILEEGDSIYYDSIVDHLVTAGGQGEATILAVIYTPS